MDCVLWEQSLTETFAQMVTKQADANKERLGIGDKKALRDPDGSIIKPGGQVLFLKDQGVVVATW